MTATLDFQTRQGSTFRRLLSFTTSAGVAINITAYTIRGQVRETWDPGSALVVEFTVVPVDLSSGQVALLVADTDTDAIPAGNYVYDLELVDPATGDVDCPIRGAFKVLPGVTR